MRVRRKHQLFLEQRLFAQQRLQETERTETTVYESEEEKSQLEIDFH